ncbi:amino acid ABC transporter permease [Erwinia amylovora]
MTTQQAVPSLKVIPARYPLRLAGAVFSLFILLGILQSIATNPRWEWQVFARWFFDPAILSGLGKTLLLTLLGTVFGTLIGTALALARLSQSWLLKALAWGYIWLFRSLPLLLVLIILYNFSYLYDNLSLGIPFTSVTFFTHATTELLDQFTVAVLGLSMVQGAYTAEIIRGGITGVDHGQHEAAAALGLPPGRRTFRIILPQALRAILPTGFNEVISLAKGTAIVYVLSMPELFYTVQVLYNRTQQVIPLLMVASVWYLLITTVLSILQHFVERFFSRGVLRPTVSRRLNLFRRALRA